MVKICHMTSAHQSLDDRIFEKECVSLAKKDNYEVYLVAQGTSFEKNGVRIVGIGEIVSGRIKRILKITKQIYRAALEIDADIYHFHDPELLPYGYKLKKKGKIVIFDSHESYYHQIKEKKYIPKLFRNFIAKVYVKYETRVSRMLDAVIFPSLIFGKHPFEGRCTKTVFLNNVPSLELVYNKYDKEEKQWTGRVVCYTGGLTYERGITTLVEACYMANARLILAGNFSPKEYQDELMQSKAYKCVDYRGQCSRQEILKIFNEATIGANILLNVGQYQYASNLSTKVYEYMAFSLPIIINDYPYGRTVIEDYKLGLVADSSDYVSVANAINYIFDNRDKAREMGENGRRVVEKHFNWSIEEKKLFELYNELLADRESN